MNQQEIYLEASSAFSDANNGRKLYVSEIVELLNQGVTVVNAANGEVLSKADIQEWCEVTR